MKVLIQQAVAARPVGERAEYPHPFSTGHAALRAEYVENGAEVMRCHTFPTLRPQTVGHHSFGVAWWCIELTGGCPHQQLLMAALAHDLPEARFGDMPAPTKRNLTIEAREELAAAELHSMREVGLPDFDATLSRQELLVLKLADYLELLAYTVREMALGNRHRTLLLCFVNARQYVNDLLRTYNEESWSSLPYIVARAHLTRLVNHAKEYVDDLS